MWLLGSVPPPAIFWLDRIAEVLSEVTDLEVSAKEIEFFESKVPLVLVLVQVDFQIHLQIAASDKYGKEIYDPDPFAEIYIATCKTCEATYYP